MMTLFLTVVLFVWSFFLFLNDYIHWWYTLVLLILYIPLLLAASFTISWFTQDTKTTRALMYTATLLALISFCCVALWDIIYFVWLYKRDSFMAGMGDPKTNEYTKQSKKTFIFTFLAESLICIGLYAYFICVASNYQEAMHGP